MVVFLLPHRMMNIILWIRISLSEPLWFPGLHFGMIRSILYSRYALSART